MCSPDHDVTLQARMGTWHCRHGWGRDMAGPDGTELSSTTPLRDRGAGQHWASTTVHPAKDRVPTYRRLVGRWGIGWTGVGSVTCWNCNHYKPCSVVCLCTDLKNYRYSRDVACCQFAGALKETEKGIISFVMSVRLYFHLPTWNNSTPAGRIFMKFDIWVFFENTSKRNKVAIISDKNIRYCRENLIIFVLVSLYIFFFLE
jgi:hypothetical protein